MGEKDSKGGLGNSLGRYVGLFVFSFLFLFLFSCSKLASKRVTLIYAGFATNEEAPLMEEAFAKFEKLHPEVKVKFYRYPWDQYWPKIEAMIAAGTPPDVMYMGGARIPDMAERGELLDIKPYLLESHDPSYSDYYPAALKVYEHKGGLYAVPRDVAPLAVFCNVELFEERGVSLPGEDWDWNDLLAKAKALTYDSNNDGNPDVFGFATWFYVYDTFTFLLQNGANILSSDRKRSVIDSPQAIEAVNFMRSLITKHHVSPKVMLRSDINFERGNVGMSLDGYWMVTHYNKAVSFDWTVVPVFHGKKYGVYLAETGYAVASHSKHRDWAVKLALFLANSENQWKNLEAGLAIPALRSIASSEKALSLPHVKPFVWAMEKGIAVSPPYTRSWLKIEKLMGDAMQKVFALGQEPAVVLHALAEEIDSVLAQSQ